MKLLRRAGWAMIWVGGLLLAFLAYQVFGTGLLNSRSQTRGEEALEARFASLRPTLELPVEPSGDGPPAEVAGPEEAEPDLYEEPVPLAGEPVGVILIAEANVEAVVFQGVERADLKKGPGHMPWSPLPGQPGNAVISGHRTTYGAPFFDLDLLELGDELTVETALGEHVFAVRKILIVAPTDVWVTEYRPGAWLTLTTCNPRWSSAERLVVVAELVEGANLAYAQTLLAEPQTPLSDLSR